MDWDKFVLILSPEDYRSLNDAMIRNHKCVMGLPALNDPERCLANGGHKIPAIKMYRERTMCGLKEAKDQIEAYMGNGFT